MMKHRSRIFAIGLTGALAGALAALPTVAPGTAQAAVAYTVEPLGGTDTTPSLFGGAVCQVYECVKVPTPATVDPTHVDGVFGEDGSIAEGAASLDATLVADPDEKLVFGFSQGAQVGGFWLRNYAPTTTVDPDATSFLFVGDPENTYGVPWAPRVPTDTGFAVTELWAQYDGWADWPDRFGVLPMANAVYGMLFVHPTVYDDMDLAAEEAAGNVVTWETGGITHKMVVEHDVPLLDPLRNIGLDWLADAVNDDLREHIEEHYDRPSTQEEADAMFGDAADEAADETADTDVTSHRASRDNDGEDDDAATERADTQKSDTKKSDAGAADASDDNDDDGPSKKARSPQSDSDDA